MKFSGTMVGSDNSKKLGEFYTKVLGDPSMQGGDWYGWKGDAQLMIGGHSEVKSENDMPQRIMLTLETTDVKGEFKRLTELGAKVVAEPYQPGEAHDMWLATVSDPDGNYLQLSTPWT